VAKDFGFPVESVLLSSGLPGQLPEASDSFLLERNCWSFVHAISKKEFCCLYGLIAAERIPWVENPTLKPFVSGGAFPQNFGECRRQKPSSLANKSLIILK